MKKLGRILVVSLIVIFAGCEQSQQKQTSDVSRKDRLIANENLSLKNELAQYRSEIEKQQNLLQQCQQEKEKTTQDAGDTAKWLMDELPQDLLNQVEQLAQENEQLKAEIAGHKAQTPAEGGEGQNR